MKTNVSSKHQANNVLVGLWKDGIIRDAKHHANHILKVIPLLSGCVVYHSDNIEVYSNKDGELRHTCWCEINGETYVFIYNYNNKCIDMRYKNSRGETLLSFDNNHFDYETMFEIWGIEKDINNNLNIS